MDERLKKMVKKHNAEVVFLPIEGNGYILRGTHGKLNQIIVNSSLSDEMSEKVILHEIGHLKRDDNVIGSYRYNYISRLCSESGANDYMIKEKVKEYVALGNEPISTNYIDLAHCLGVEDYSKVRLELSKYIIE